MCGQGDCTSSSSPSRAARTRHVDARGRAGVVAALQSAGCTQAAGPTLCHCRATERLPPSYKPCDTRAGGQTARRAAAQRLRVEGDAGCGSVVGLKAMSSMAGEGCGDGGSECGVGVWAKSRQQQCSVFVAGGCSEEGVGCAKTQQQRWRSLRAATPRHPPSSAAPSTRHDDDASRSCWCVGCRIAALRRSAGGPPATPAAECSICTREVAGGWRGCVHSAVFGAGGVWAM